MEIVRKELNKDEVLDLIKHYCDMINIKADYSDILTLDSYSYKDNDRFPGLIEYMEVKELAGNANLNTGFYMLLRIKLGELLRSILRLELEEKFHLYNIELTSDIDMLYFTIGNNEFINELYSEVPNKLILKELENYYSVEDENLVEIIPFYPCKLICGMVDRQIEYFINKVYECLLLKCAYEVKVLLLKYKDIIYKILQREFIKSNHIHTVNSLDEYIDYIAQEKIDYTLGLYELTTAKKKEDISIYLKSLISRGLKSIYYDKLKEIE